MVDEAAPRHNPWGHPLVATAGLARADWLAARRQGLGGSDLAALVRGDVWRVYRAKVDRVDEPETEAMRWGRRLEDDVVEETATRHPTWRIQRRHAILQHPTVDWALADIDRFVRHDRQLGLLEVKTSARSWEDGVPAPVQAQVQHYLWVTGAPWVVVAVLHLATRQYAEYTLTPDPDQQVRQARLGWAFWRLVETRTPPPLDGSAAAREWLLAQYPAPRRPEPVTLPPDAAAAAARYAEIRDRTKELEGERDVLGAQLRAAIGEAKAGISDTHKVSWVRSMARSFDPAAFRADHPDLYEQYTTERLRDGGLRVTERRD